jgi:gliding motility-associated-like protein
MHRFPVLLYRAIFSLKASLFFSAGRAKILLACLAIFSLPSSGRAQIQTSGKEFWFSSTGDQGYTYLYDIKLTLVAAEAAEVTLTYTLNGSTSNYSLDAGEIITVSATAINCSVLTPEVVTNRSLHISSTGYISVYLLSAGGATDDASMLIPVDQPEMGSVFYPVTFYYQKDYVGSVAATFTARCDSTVLEITPAQLSSSGQPAGVPYQVTLGQGDVYEVASQWNTTSVHKDLTGWKVEVISSTCCNAVSAFTAVLPMYIYPDSISAACCADIWAEVVLPQKGWDSVNYFVPFRYKNFDIVRIISADDNNEIRFGSNVVATLNAGEFVEGSLDTATVIHSDFPVEVVQFMVSNSCDPQIGWNGDPSMVTVTSLKNAITKTSFTTDYPFSNPDMRQLVNLVLYSADTNDVLLNGTTLNDVFHPYTSQPEIAYAQIELSNNTDYVLECDGGFIATLYGMYQDGSYALQLPLFGLPAAPPVPAEFEADTVCGTPATLQALPGMSYLWNDSTTASSLEVTDSGLYHVYILLDECTDTFQFFYVLPAVIDSGLSPADTLYNCGNPVQLQASGGATYLWDNGSTDSVITVTDPGNYGVTVKENVCYGKYEVHVLLPFVDTLSHLESYSMFYCQSPLALSSADGISYLWNTGEISQTITVTGPGYYSVVVNSEYCVFDTLVFLVEPQPEYLFPFSIGADTAICYGDSLQLTGVFAETLWSTGQTGLEIKVNQPGVYWAVVADSCSAAIYSDTLYVENKVCICHPLFPNAFSPNNDGMNDFFSPIHAPDCVYTSYRMQVFNRWGQLVFENTDASEGWNGRLNGTGADQSLGVFVYYCQYSLDGSPESLVEKGNVTLLR